MIGVDVMVSKIDGRGCINPPRDLVGRVVDISVVDLTERNVRVRVNSEADLEGLFTGCGLRLIKKEDGVFEFTPLDSQPF